MESNEQEGSKGRRRGRTRRKKKKKKKTRRRRRRRKDAIWELNVVEHGSTNGSKMVQWGVKIDPWEFKMLKMELSGPWEPPGAPKGGVKRPKLVPREVPRSSR